jgi:hypothetical protein
MTAAHKSESPAATGLCADQNTHATDFTPDQKRLATLRAKAALTGHVLHAIEGDNGQTLYIFSKWAQVRQLENIERAETWLAHVTGEKQ